MKIYPSLYRLGITLVISTLLSLVALSQSPTVLLIGNVLSIVVYGATLWFLRQIAGESARLSRALLFHGLSLTMITLSLIVSILPAQSDMIATFSYLTLLSGSLCNLLGDYFFYWGLDERILPCGYAFPARRIRWCFYLPLLGAFAASSLQLATQGAQSGTLLLIAFQAAALGLYFRYVLCVRAREENPLE